MHEANATGEGAHVPRASEVGITVAHPAQLIGCPDHANMQELE